MEGWRGGEVERWRGGEMERWRDGEVERWRGGEVEKWRLYNDNNRDEFSQKFFCQFPGISTNIFQHKRNPVYPILRR